MIVYWIGYGFLHSLNLEDETQLTTPLFGTGFVLSLVALITSKIIAEMIKEIDNKNQL
jgi:hypothetical protein